MFVPIWVLCVIAVLAAAFVARRELDISRLRKDRDLFRAVAEGASDGLVLMEMDSKIVWANPAYSRIMGRPMDQIIGHYPLKFALPPDAQLPEEEVKSFRFCPNEERFGKLTQFRNIRGDGTEFMHEFSHAALPWGTDDHRVLLVGRDISERIAREEALLAAKEQLAEQAKKDALTGLANRMCLQEKINDLMKGSAPFVVMIMDMNGFKDINDRHGHGAGDAILRKFADVLSRHAEASWLCARMGGDEFAVVAPNYWLLDDALIAAKEITRAFAEPTVWQSGALRASVSVGMALRTPDVASTDDLLNRADVALYKAKERPDTDIAVYDAEMHDWYLRDQSLRLSVAEALKREEIAFHLQPIIDVEDQTFLKFEMLARWYRADGTMIAPDAFLGTLANLGLNALLDQYVVKSAGRFLQHFDRRGLGHAGLSINLTSTALVDHNIADLLIWEAHTGNLDASRVAIEFLETTALPTAQEAPCFLQIQRLRQAGFRIFLDDFGMGHAGLAHLAGLDVQGIKVDRKLTSAVAGDETSLCIVKALIGLSEELGLEVVAEGIETEEQMNIARRLGCTVFQGFHVARPMRVEDAINWARAWSAQYPERVGEMRTG